MPRTKSLGAANRQSPLIPRKFVDLYYRITKIRMRSDKQLGKLTRVVIAATLALGPARSFRLVTKFFTIKGLPNMRWYIREF